MSTIARLRRLSLAVTVLAIAGCADSSRPSPLEPAAPAASDLRLPILGELLTCTPLPADSVTKVIGPSGGYIAVGPHFFLVPYGSLSAPVAITAVIPAGSTANVVRFQPEGLQFSRGASLTLSYANCDLLTQLLPKRIAHTALDLSILEFVPSFDLFYLKRVTGRLEHFSDYAVAW
jgi:hypothetical protein